MTVEVNDVMLLHVIHRKGSDRLILEIAMLTIEVVGAHLSHTAGADPRSRKAGGQSDDLLQISLASTS